jgi:hypothetical protein
MALTSIKLVNLGPRLLGRRKQLVLREVFTSMSDVIALAKGEGKKSLATIKPTEISSFKVEPTDREWKEKWTVQAPNEPELSNSPQAWPAHPQGPIRLLLRVHDRRGFIAKETQDRGLGNRCSLLALPSQHAR